MLEAKSVRAAFILTLIASGFAFYVAVSGGTRPGSSLPPLSANQIPLQRLEPVLHLPSYTDPRAGRNFHEDPNEIQLAIPADNLIYYAQGKRLVVLDPTAQRILWTQALPWLFTAWHDLLITAGEFGLVTAYRNRELIWSARALNLDGSPSQRIAQFLRVVNGNLLVQGYTKADFYDSLTTSLEPSGGRVIWSKNVIPLNRKSFVIARDRYVVITQDSDSPMGPPTSSLLDVKTGWYFERDIEILNQSLSSDEFVRVDYPVFIVPNNDHDLRESYTVHVSVYANRQPPRLVQDLGVFDLTPPLRCLGRSYPVNLYNGSLAAYKGKLITTQSESVGFFALNANAVWLEIWNECNRRLVQLSRDGSRATKPFDFPEPLPLKTREAQYRSSGGRLPFVRGIIPTPTRVDLLGESPALASVRNQLPRSDVLWFRQRGRRVYALLRQKELRVYDDRAVLLKRYRLAVPDLKYYQETDDPNQIDLTERIFTWRGGIIAESYFFLLP